MKLKLLLFGAVLIAATLIPTPAIGQDAPMAMQSKPIWLQMGKEGKFLGENRDDYATMNERHEDYIFESTSGADPAKPLKHNQSYKIKLGGMYLYCTAKGNAGLYKTANDEASTWTIVKLPTAKGDDDDIIRYGDTIKLRNGYWKTSYLYDNGTGFAAAGDYPDKPQKWDVKWKLSKIERTIIPDVPAEIIRSTIFIDNRGGEASPAFKQTMSLGFTDMVGVRDSNSSNWNAGVSVTATASSNVGGPGPGASLSVTASAAFGGEINNEVTKSREVTQSKSVEFTIDRPKDCEVFITADLSVPYEHFTLSTEGLESIKMRSAVKSNVSYSTHRSIYIPRVTQGKLEPVDENEVYAALANFGKSNLAEATRLRKERLPVWQKNGWVTARAGVNACVLAPGESMNVKEKYWSANKQFYAIFQPDGNFGVSTKTDGYKWDIYTQKPKAPVINAAKKLVLELTGNLVFLDKDNKIIWSIEKLVKPVASSTLHLSDSGELLLLGPDGTVLWNNKK